MAALTLKPVLKQRRSSRREGRPGGKGLNQAVALSRLGVRTHLVGCLGRRIV